MELALGAPCDQLIVAWTAGEKSGRWGSVVGPDAARGIRYAVVSPLAADDLAKVLQAIIDLPELQQYYHESELPGRKRLRLRENRYVTAGLPGLSKFGLPVQFTRAQAGEVPQLELTDIEVDADKVQTHFEYRVEGIVGSATFKEVQGSWRKQAADLIER